MTLRGEAGEIVNDPRAQEPAVGLRSPEPERRPLACLSKPSRFRTAVSHGCTARPSI